MWDEHYKKNMPFVHASPQDISEWSYLLILARAIDSVTKLNSLLVEPSELELHIQLRSISFLSSCPQTIARRVETRRATQTCDRLQQGGRPGASAQGVHQFSNVLFFNKNLHAC